MEQYCLSILGLKDENVNAVMLNAQKECNKMPENPFFPEVHGKFGFEIVKILGCYHPLPGDVKILQKP